MDPIQLMLWFVRAVWMNPAALVAENAALRQQLAVYKRERPRPKLRRRDRIFWVWLSWLWSDWRSVLVIVQPETVVGWHRAGFRLYWRFKSRKSGRPKVSDEVRQLIRRMAKENPLWGAPRIQTELKLLGHELAESTVAKYLPRDRDGIYGEVFQRRVESLGIEEVISAPRSPWQSPYVERLIGSIRRECLDHVIVLNERHLMRILADYFRYYNQARTHQSLGGNSPDARHVEPP